MSIDALTTGGGSAPPLDLRLADALEHLRAGRLKEAGALYYAILNDAPNHAEALHFFGVVHDGLGEPARAAELIGRALQIAPSASAYSNLGMALAHLGRHDEALNNYARALELRPAYADAVNNRGVSHEALGLLDRAEADYREAVALRPSYHQAWTNLGHVLRGGGRIEEAVAAYERAAAHNPAMSQAALGHGLRELDRLVEAEAAFRRDLAANPDDADAKNNLAAILGERGRYAEAVQLLPDVVTARPEHPEAFSNLGLVLKQLGRFEEAEDATKRALVLRPDYPEALSNLGAILRDRDRLDESEGALRRALALSPADVAAYNNLAITLQEQGRLDEARALLDLAAALRPDDAETQHHLAMLFLMQGRFNEGWGRYDRRFDTKQAAGSRPGLGARPVWRGENIAGRTIFIAPEQGLGDTIQFIRYASLVAERGARVILGVQKPLRGLAAALPGIAKVLGPGDEVPDHDVVCPMLSLPGAFGTTLDDVPASVPYLTPSDEALARWRRRPLGEAGSLRVGIVWAGNPQHLNDRRRSLPFAALAPLWEVPGVSWFSLQVGPRAADLADAPAGRIVDLAPDLHDFGETAAAVAVLDLVIAADTSVAHLAGATGRPVWLLVAAASDWRWLRDTERSPWYPTMRVFRQDGERSWPPVVAAVAGALRDGEAVRRLRGGRGDRQHSLIFEWGVSSYFGWGVYGLNLLLNLAGDRRLAPASTEPVNPAALDVDELDKRLLAPALERSRALTADLAGRPGRPVSQTGPLLFTLNNGLVRGANHHGVALDGWPSIGVAFLDQTDWAPGRVAALGACPLVVAGSRWNQQLLRDMGLPRVELVLQGVDTSLFHPAPDRGLLAGRFVVFSGGKLEHRKGQDIVLRAFALFARRHPDALLMTAWGSPWPEAARSLNASPLTTPPSVGEGGRIDVRRWAEENGVAARQVLDIGVVSNRAMARILREADVALFPNRAEGGTNLVAMEAMACGLPCILSANTGHLDLIAGDNCLSLDRQAPVAGQQHRGWGESAVDEVVEALERLHRDARLRDALGQAGAAFLAPISWRRQIGTLSRLISELIP